MNLFDTVNQEIKEAMKARNEARLRTFRNIKSSFLLLQSSGTEQNETAYLQAVQKLAKQLRDSISIFEKEGRNDLANKEKEELLIVEELLPKQLDAAEIENRVNSVIAETGASGMKDLGKVMPLAMKNMAGLADGKIISETVKRLLGG